MVYVYNPNIQEAEAGGRIQGQPKLYNNFHANCKAKLFYKRKQRSEDAVTFTGRTVTHIGARPG